MESLFVCPNCSESKPRTAFYTRANGHPGGYCQECAKQNSRDQKLRERIARQEGQPRECQHCGADLPLQGARPGQWRKYCVDCSMDLKLLKRFKITAKEKQALLDEQGGVCAVCGSSDPAGKSGKGWSVDHDHSCCDNESGKPTCGQCIRGILCNRCNRAMGLMADDPARLRAAADYLESFRA